MALRVRNRWDEKRDGCRVHLNIAATIDVRVRFLSLSAKPRFRVRIEDASVSGLQFWTNHPLKNGSRLFLWVDVDVGGTERRIKLSGRVMWTRALGHEDTYLAGLHLDPRPRSSMKLWRQYILGQAKRLTG